jgi:hypothetical protein
MGEWCCLIEVLSVFNVIINFLQSVQWDAVQEVPYAHAGNEWLSFDNVQSIEIKVDSTLTFASNNI